MAGFADATGRQLPLVCTLNGAPVLAAVADDARRGLRRTGPAGAVGARGCGGAHPGAVLRWRTLAEPSRSRRCAARRDDTKPDARQRCPRGGRGSAQLDGVLHRQDRRAGRRRASASSWSAGERARRRSGGSRRRSSGTPVHVPTPAEYVALGAARQAAWTLSQQDSPPPWSFGVTATLHRRPDAPGGRAVPRRAAADAGPVNVSDSCQSVTNFGPRT